MRKNITPNHSCFGKLALRHRSKFIISHIVRFKSTFISYTNLPRFANHKNVPADYCNTPRQLNGGLISRTNSKEVAMIYLDIKDLQNTFMIARFFSAYFDLCKNALKTFFGSGFLSLKVFYDNQMGLQEYLKLCYQILIVPNYHHSKIFSCRTISTFGKKFHLTTPFA